MKALQRRPKALLAYKPESNLGAFGAEQLVRRQSLIDLLHPDAIEDFTQEPVPALLQSVEVLITAWGAPKITREVLDAAPQLRLIAHIAGSVKELVDPLAWERGIAVTNAVVANAEPVAEYTLAAILFSNKRVFQMQSTYREKRREHKTIREAAPGIGNYRKTIGIVGASRVGRRVIDLLANFSFTVLLCDPYVSQLETGRLGIELVDLDTLIERSDIVSLHAPLTSQTRGMLNARRLACMRNGAVLINTARAQLVDQEALIHELLLGRIDAVLDVTEPEPLAANSPLYDLPNVFLTPHCAGSVGTERQRLTETIFDEIARYNRGEALQHLVVLHDLEHLA